MVLDLDTWNESELHFFSLQFLRPKKSQADALLGPQPKGARVTTTRAAKALASYAGARAAWLGATARGEARTAEVYERAMIAAYRKIPPPFRWR
jgi:hypothetical protein